MPALPHNIERSAFRPREYVAHTPGGAWRVRKHGCGGWEATPGVNSDPAMFNPRHRRAATLDALAALLLLEGDA